MESPKGHMCSDGGQHYILNKQFGSRQFLTLLGCLFIPNSMLCRHGLASPISLPTHLWKSCTSYTGHLLYIFTGHQTRKTCCPYIHFFHTWTLAQIPPAISIYITCSRFHRFVCQQCQKKQNTFLFSFSGTFNEVSYKLEYNIVIIIRLATMLLNYRSCTTCYLAALLTKYLWNLYRDTIPNPPPLSKQGN